MMMNKKECVYSFDALALFLTLPKPWIKQPNLSVTEVVHIVWMLGFLCCIRSQRSSIVPVSTSGTALAMTWGTFYFFSDNWKSSFIWFSSSDVWNVDEWFYVSCFDPVREAIGRGGWVNAASWDAGVRDLVRDAIVANSYIWESSWIIHDWEGTLTTDTLRNEASFSLEA